jgi:hypothetical protein
MGEKTKSKMFPIGKSAGKLFLERGSKKLLPSPVVEVAYYKVYDTRRGAGSRTRLFEVMQQIGQME